MSRPTVLSLYTGAGGLDLGLEAAGFETRACVEMEPKACATLRKNRPDWQVIESPIGEVSTRKLLRRAGLKKGEATLLAGGPPCQPFSKSAHWIEGNVKGIRDPRARTLVEFIRVLEEARPKAFLMENVHGMAYGKHFEALLTVIRAVNSLGYSFDVRVLNAADYGVPQIRQRLFIVGARDGVDVKLPQPTHATRDEQDGRVPTLFDLRLPPHVPAGEALASLEVDRPPAPDEVVGGKWGHLLPEIPPGENYLYLTAHKKHPKPLFKWRSKYWSFLLKLSPEKPAWTIQATPGPYVGPFHWRDRRLSLAETKRLMTFPDDYEVLGSRTVWQKQLGNAVAPRLAEVLGRSILKQLGLLREKPVREARAAASAAP